MARGTELLLSSALLLGSVAVAHADPVTYDVATTQVYSGTVSGSVSGSGSTVTGFDIVAVNGINSFTFDSSNPADTAFFYPDGLTTSSGTPVSSIQLDDSSGDSFFLVVTGDFSTGLTYVGSQEVYFNGQDTGTTFTSASVFNSNGMVTSDDVSLTPAVAPTPEPSSLLLMAAGVAGLCTTLRRARS